MGLLDGFEELNENFENSIEYYLNFMVVKDRYPIVMDFSEYLKCQNQRIYDFNEVIWPSSPITPNRVHIISGVGCGTDQLAGKFVLLLGTPEKGFRNISIEEYNKYLELFEKQWPDVDVSRLCINNVFSDYLFTKYRSGVAHSSPYDIIVYDSDFVFDIDNYGKPTTQNYRILYKTTNEEVEQNYIIHNIR